MYALYFIGFILPALVGGVRWYFKGKINWPEWGISTGIGLLVSLGFQIGLYYGMTGDQQVYSGQIKMAKHFAAWMEHYQYAVYRTEYYTVRVSDGNGKSHSETRSRQVFDHWANATRYHSDSWTDYSNIATEYEIDKSSYEWTRGRFGGEHAVPGVRSTTDHDSYMIAGDPNDYEAPDQTGFIVPVTATRHWVNKVKCCPSVFSYTTPPKTEKLFAYPFPTDPFHSNRLLGKAADSVNLAQFDQMCARLGPPKKVNVILIGFGDRPEMTAHYQEAVWVGGKKNDLVLCFGGNPDQPSWVYCFGWTEAALVKRNLETLAINEGVNTKSLPDIEQQIKSNYTLKDWKKFDYLTIEPPTWSYWAVFFSVILALVGFWYGAYQYEQSNDY